MLVADASGRAGAQMVAVEVGVAKCHRLCDSAFGTCTCTGWAWSLASSSFKLQTVEPRSIGVTWS